MDGSVINIACVGEAMVEFSEIFQAGKPVEVNVAGDTLNTAIYLKRLMGAKVQVSYVSVLGYDPFSKKILDFMNAESIDTRHIRKTDEANAGIYTIENGPSGERSFTYWRENSAARQLFDRLDDFDDLDKFDYIYFSGISLGILPTKQKERFLLWLSNLDKKVTIIFDTNFRKQLWSDLKDASTWITKALKLSDMAMPSSDDMVELYKTNDILEVAQRFSSKKKQILEEQVMNTGS